MDDNQNSISSTSLIDSIGAQGSSYDITASTASGTGWYGPYIGPIGCGVGSGVYTLPITNGGTTFTDSVVQPSGTLALAGDNADILINGQSLNDTLRGIQDRLNLLRPNPELESKWDQLRELGEAYRKLEAELEEKQRMWDTLKKMPAPNIK